MNIKSKATFIAIVMTLAINTISAENAANNDFTTYDSMYKDYPSSPSFNNEVRLGSNSTTFSLWSPKAQAVKVNIYNKWNDKTPAYSFNLKYNNQTGIWTGNVTKKSNKIASSGLIGKFYTFQIKYNDKWLNETPGIWAKAVSVNGEKAAIIDFSKTNPVNWSKDKSPKLDNQTDAIIYEMHHRDFSANKNSGIKNKGKFIAMLENGTLSVNGEKTGIDHLKELGITHVHILPSYDFNSVDEKALKKNNYNWGYDPINYNVPDGSYSTNPYNPSTRIKEMKEMIQALHKAGIGVVMDVVYNHTAENDNSNFSLTAPGYFYRHLADGSYSNASGCNNETASDRDMVRHYIISSVKYWAKEYHIDGFRFDLMAIHDLETINQLTKELRTLYPSIILYGEGWTAGDSPLPVEKRALKENAMLMPGMAVFSDDIRDGIKGHYSNESDRGFASGKEGTKEMVKMGIVGAVYHPQVKYAECNYAKKPYTLSPLQVVNYVSCHDDLCLTDKLKISMPNSTTEDMQRVAKLAQTIVFTSQGMPFMFNGEEIFRDKKGVHNSYNSPDSINAIDWNLKKTNKDIFNYYKNLIALRKEHPAFRMTKAEDVTNHLVFDNNDNSPLFISYTLKGNANGDSWQTIKVFFNGSDEIKKVSIPKGKWKIIASDGKINKDGLGETSGGNLIIYPKSATIIAE